MRLSHSLLGLAFLLPAGAALAEDPPMVSGTSEADAADLAGELDQVVREALEQGLLAPVGRAGDPVPPVPTDAVDQHAAAEHPVATSTSAGCDAMTAPDFSDVSELSRYQDIHTLPIHGGVAPDPAEVELLAKAYIALGMNSEAMMVMQRSTHPGLQKYREIAVMMESRVQPNLQFFHDLAACDSEADFWYGIALVADNRAEGVPLLRNHMSDYRQLPLQLKANAATILASALSGLDEVTLARRLLADFSEDEIRNSSRLRFSIALLNMSEGRFEDEDIVRDFMLEPQYQQEALSALLRNDREVSGVQNDLVLEALMREMSLVENEADLAASLGFTLRELSQGTQYEKIAQLSRLPTLQGEDAQDAIRRHYISALRRGLSSEAPLGNLAAVRALLSETRLVMGQPEEAELFQQATQRAVELGRFALAEQLALMTHADDQAAAFRAGLAFRHGEDAAVVALAREHPHDFEMTLLGARSAIRIGDEHLLATLINRLDLDQPAILALIEEDAISGRWIVPQHVYDQAADFIEAEPLERATRVLAARFATQRASAETRAVAIADVPELLERADLTLQALNREMH